MVNKWMLYLEQSPIILISYEQLDSKIVEGGKLISIRIDPEKVDSILGYAAPKKCVYQYYETYSL